MTLIPQITANRELCKVNYNLKMKQNREKLFSNSVLLFIST